MTKSNQNQYQPDYVTPPGHTLLETLDSIGMSQRDLALRTGRPVKTINEIIKGKTAITAETALQFERVLGISAKFWINRERHYRDFVARRDEEETLKKHIPWLSQIPFREMARHGWISRMPEPIQQMRELLNFFGVRSPRQYLELWDSLQVNFRMSKSFQVNRDALAAWLRKGEMEAQKINCEPFDKEKFRNNLLLIRRLTNESLDVFQPKLAALSAECGVAVVFIPELPKTRTSGAARWLTPRKAMIQLSLRYKTDDMLWFTFYHEAAHLLLHGKRSLFLDYEKSEGSEEEEANRVAEELIIPSKKLSAFTRSRRFSEAAIVKFSDAVGVSPGVVVGRLQHLGYLPHSHLNELKRKFRWVD